MSVTPSPGSMMTLFWPLWTPGMHVMHKYTHRQNIYNTSKFFELFKIDLFSLYVCKSDWGFVHMSAVAARVQKRSLDPLGLVYRQFWASSCECWKPSSSIREVFGINFNYWDISKALASMTLMSIVTSWKKYCYSTKEIKTKALFSGKLQNAWSDSISQF